MRRRRLIRKRNKQRKNAFLSEEQDMTEPDMADAQHVDQIVRPLHVVFLHLDLGIGGAEQLVLQLAILVTGFFDLGFHTSS